MAHVATVTIQSSQVPGDLTDFPIYIDLSDMPSGFWSTVANGGGDIRVYKDDDTTELAREVVACDTTSETGELHVKFTGTLSSSSDTDIHIHADGTSSDYATTATYGRNNVWSDYEYVYHLDDTTDSAGNTNLTAQGGATTGSTGGKIRDYTQLDGSDDNFTIADNDPGGNFTIQAWVNFDAYVNGQKQIWNKWNTGQRSVMLQKNESADTTERRKIRAYYSSDGNFDGTTILLSTTATSASTWYKVDLTFEASTAFRLYINGSEEDSMTSGVHSAIYNGTESWRLGGYPGDILTFDGGIDEARIRFGLLSANWLQAEHTNQDTPSTFYTVSDPSSSATDNALAWCNF